MIACNSHQLMPLSQQYLMFCISAVCVSLRLLAPVMYAIVRLFPDISLLATFTGGPMTVPYACTLLEYCLVTGLDWWDLLVSLRPSMMDTVCERFTDSFNRQPQQIQQFHYVQFLNIKTSLYRCSEILTPGPMRTITALRCPCLPLIAIFFLCHG